MRYFYLTFFCLFLLRPAPSYQDDRDDESDIAEDNSHLFNSVVNIPGDDSSGDEGNAESRPVVNHQRFKKQNGKLVKKRRRRSAFGEPNRPNYEGDNRRTRYVDYNGWRPLDIVDPMLNEPTFIYKPPTLQRVHFGEGPPEEKPMFPILPVNPTVYVVRAEAEFPAAKRHAIYGTENVDYLHINPQSNSAKVYSSFHEAHNDNNSSSKDNLNQNDSNIEHQPAKDVINAAKITNKDAPSAAIRNPDNEYEVEDELESTTEESEIESTTLGENDYDPIHHSNEQLLENENIIPVKQDHKTSESDPLEWLKNPLFKFAEILRGANLTINEVENGTKIEESQKLDKNSNQIKEDQQFADKSFTVGDENYYYVYEDSDYEPSADSKSTDFEDLMASGSDPFASIIPKAVQVSEDESEDPYATPDDPDENLEPSGSQQVRETVRRAPLHERLKNFGGVQFDRYIFSASENEKQFSEPFPKRPSSFGFRSTTPATPKNLRSETGRKIGATTKGKNHREWYLIETRTEEPPPKKKKVESQNSRRNDFSDRYLSKYSESPYIYNRYLDDHLKSFKPSDGLTANSLSELLQIFKYVTTPAPNQGKSFNEKTRRTFRYTKPTNPPRYTTSPPLLFTTFRYSIAEPDYPSYTELPFEDFGVLEGPLIVLNDSVAETNSLDGYLFSDSVASPEYKTLDQQPNVIRFHPKEEALVKFDKIAEEAGKMDKHAVRRGELSPTLVIDAPKNSEKEKDSFDLDSSAYHIYEGHSKVKIFGSNVDENGMNKKNDTKRAKSLTQNPYKFYDHLTTLPPGVVIRPIGMMSVHPSFKTRGAGITERTTSTQSTSATKSFSATLPPDVFTRSQYFGMENQRLSSVGNVANFNPAQKKANLQSNNDEPFVHFPTDFYDYFSLHGNDELSSKNNNDDININVYPEQKLITHNFKYSKPPYPRPIPSERLQEGSQKPTIPESTERILDLSSLPSSIESFSKLILSYFSRNTEKETPENTSESLTEGKSEDTKQKQIDHEQENPKPEKKQNLEKEKAERSLTDYFSYLKSLESNK